MKLRVHTAREDSYKAQMGAQIQITINFLDLSGGLFEETNSVEEIAFKYAVDHINRSTFLCFDFEDQQ